MVVAALLAPGAVRGASLSATYVAWPKGPVRWLLLPEEARAYSRLASDDEAAAFIVAFWRQRDPDPSTQENSFADRFSERVVMADQIYREDRRRGALTVRGGAFILLGSPSFLRAEVRQKAVPASRDAVARPTQPVLVETWGYAPTELPRGAAEMLGRRDAHRVEIQFVVEEKRTYLASGKEVLTAVARALSVGGGS
jgi:GWxTD domain-containing protein